MKRDLRLVVGLAVWFSVLPLVSQETSRPLVIQNVRIFDGSGVTSGGTVVVQGVKIASVGKGVAPPAGAEVIDGAGHTLLPGLIDCHTHLINPASLKQALIFGVTTELDMFTEHRFAAEARKQQAAGQGLDRADLFSAGTLVTAPGGHGTEYGVIIPTITAPEEAQAFVDARIAEGSDYIKIVYDDGKPWGMSFSTINKATMAAVIAAAHKRGKLAVVHIGSHQDASDAIEAGANGLVHIFADRSTEPGFGRFVSARRAFVIPTLTVLESASGVQTGASLVSNAALAPYLSDPDVASLKRTFPVRPGAYERYALAEEALRNLRAAKVPILAGTDAPNPGTIHGASLHRELELLVRAGLTPLEALAGATSLAAEHFKLADRGRIAPGQRADLVLVKGDPTTDIKDTRNIVRVWKLGVPASRESYREAIEKQRALAQRFREAPAPPGAESGLASDFEDGKAASKFGSGWVSSTDSMLGGKSTAKFTVVSGGANDSKLSLSITGEIIPGATFTWAGAMFLPGAAPMAPANLSSKKEITFWAKGDGKTYRLMLFSRAGGQIPSSKDFIAGPEWRRITFPLSEFDGVESYELQGLLFTGGPAPGPFTFQLDDLTFR